MVKGIEPLKPAAVQLECAAGKWLHVESVAVLESILKPVLLESILESACRKATTIVAAGLAKLSAAPTGTTGAHAAGTPAGASRAHATVGTSRTHAAVGTSRTHAAAGATGTAAAAGALAVAIAAATASPRVPS